jgi:hypothetical protein
VAPQKAWEGWGCPWPRRARTRSALDPVPACTALWMPDTSDAFVMRPSSKWMEARTCRRASDGSPRVRADGKKDNDVSTCARTRGRRGAFAGGAAVVGGEQCPRTQPARRHPPPACPARSDESRSQPLTNDLHLRPPPTTSVSTPEDAHTSPLTCDFKLAEAQCGRLSGGVHVAEQMGPRPAAHAPGQAVSVLGSFLLNTCLTCRTEPTWQAFVRYPLSQRRRPLRRQWTAPLRRRPFGHGQEYCRPGCGNPRHTVALLLTRWAITSKTASHDRCRTISDSVRTSPTPPEDRRHPGRWSVCPTDR